jgi:hypothetical protein
VIDALAIDNVGRDLAPSNDESSLIADSERELDRPRLNRAHPVQQTEKKVFTII